MSVFLSVIFQKIYLGCIIIIIVIIIIIIVFVVVIVIIVVVVVLCRELKTGSLSDNGVSDGSEIRLIPSLESGVNVR